MDNTNAVLDASAAIGIFDSGVGGLSVLRELETLLPDEKFIYFADTAHIPYGPRPLEQVRQFSIAIAGNLIAQPCKLVVVACNTASAAALKSLRQIYPAIPFVGMEPAVKPAAAGTRSGKVGVLATQATFQGELFESVVERFAKGTQVLCHACPGLAEFIESRPANDPELIPFLENIISPLLEQGIDTLVLGCTHYPLVKSAIEKVAGPSVRVVDPSPAIAKRVRQLLLDTNALAPNPNPGTVFFVSGDADAFSRQAATHLGRDVDIRVAEFSRN